VNSVEHNIEILSLSIYSDEFNNINFKLYVKATSLFIESNLSSNNNNVTVISFHNATEMMNLTDFNLELTYSLI
jgi:hypothetical protein